MNLRFLVPVALPQKSKQRLMTINGQEVSVAPTGDSIKNHFTLLSLPLTTDDYKLSPGDGRGVRVPLRTRYLEGI